MRYLVKFDFPADVGNMTVGDPEFGQKIQTLLKEMKAEAAYFTVVNGNRGGYLVVSIDDASQIPTIAEPLFYWLKANVEFIPVMLPQDLAKAGPAIQSVMQKWASSAPAATPVMGRRS